MVMEDDLTLVGGHIVHFTDSVAWKCTLETYVLLSINVLPIKLILKKERNFSKAYFTRI